MNRLIFDMICESSWNESGESDCRIRKMSRSKNIASPTSKSKCVLEEAGPLISLPGSGRPSEQIHVLVFAANILPVRVYFRGCRLIRTPKITDPEQVFYCWPPNIS